MDCKRISIITGHYGSGKTNFAVNLALDLARQKKQVCIVDLDTVNPYFRAADFQELFQQHGIRTVFPLFANSNLDLPSITGELSAVAQDEHTMVVIDAGGDDAGATVLGCYAHVLEQQPHEMYYLFNACRYHTQNSEEAAEILRQIEHTSRLKVTQIVNNSNLGHMTLAQDIEDSLEQADQLCALTNLPLACTCVHKSICPELSYNSVYSIELYGNNC